MAPAPDVDRPHGHSSRHRAEILASEVCGCFYCLRTFPPGDIECWLSDESALCPRCCTDAVIGSASGFPLTRDFLRRMHLRWFGPVESFEQILKDEDESQ
jgi:hypothetical protein